MFSRIRKAIDVVKIKINEKKEKRLHFKELRENEDLKKQKRKDELETFKELQRVPAINRRNEVM